jgi:hypothetical protein
MYDFYGLYRDGRGLPRWTITRQTLKGRKIDRKIHFISTQFGSSGFDPVQFLIIQKRLYAVCFIGTVTSPLTVTADSIYPTYPAILI